MYTPMNNGVLQPNKPFKYASRNPRTYYKNLKAGEIFLLEVEIDEETWDQVRTLPKNALIENISWHHDGDPDNPEPILGTLESPSEKKKEPSAFGYYWSYLFKQGFLNDLDMQDKLQSDADGAHAALRNVFGVEHLSASVAPAQFERWVREKGLKESFITMSKNAQVYQLGKMDKAEG